MNNYTMKTIDHCDSMINNYPQATCPASELADFARLICYDRIILDAPLVKARYHDPCHIRYGTESENAEDNSFSPSLSTDTYLTNYDSTVESFEVKQSNAVNEQIPQQPYHPLFRLLEQPHPKQRKCYRSENRYVLPNPLVICPLQFPLMIEGGKVCVRLIDNNGLPIANPGVLDNSYALEKALDQNMLCLFTLKILENSPPGNPFRFQFDITYTTTQRKTFTETILSDAFIVMPNKCVKLKGESISNHILSLNNPLVAPKVEDILPKFGPSHAITEVWIKGKDFSSRGVIVLVDGQTTQVLDVCHNLISVLIPARKELLMNKTVDIVVMNRWRIKRSIAPKTVLRFTYLVGGN